MEGSHLYALFFSALSEYLYGAGAELTSFAELWITFFAIIGSLAVCTAPLWIVIIALRWCKL